MRSPTRPLLFVSALVFVACSGAGPTCAGLTPLPNGYEGPRHDDPVQVHLSEGGFGFLNTNWERVLELVAPGRTMQLPLGCTVQSTVLGDMVIGDQGGFGCTSTSCGRMDGVCTAADLPVQLPITFDGLRLEPSPPSSVKAVVDIRIATGKLFVDSVSRSHVACLFSGGGPITCGVDFDTTRAFPLANTINATLELTPDPGFSQRLRVELASVDGLTACGSSGAAPPPACTDPNDLVLTTESGGCCPTGNSTLVKNLLLQFLAAELKTQISSMLEATTCEPCGLDGSCPVEEPGGLDSTCDATRGLCWNATADVCAPRVAGIEGRVDPLALLTPGAVSNAQMDLSLVLGHRAEADTGLTVGSRGGLRESAPSECVPLLSAPAWPLLAPVDFDAEATTGLGHHFALGVAQPFLSLAGHGLHQSGGLCLTLSTEQFNQLHTGVLRPFLPSLGAILGNQDAPLRILLRPRTAPTVEVGAGTFDDLSGEVIEPLLVLKSKDLQLDFYTLIHDRYARLFSATVDATIPISLRPDGCGRVLPVLGALGEVVTNVRFSESELLAENPSVLAELLPAVVSMAEPALAESLSSLTFPSVGVFEVELLEAKGVGRIPGTQTYAHAALYGRLVDALDCAPPPVPMTRMMRARTSEDATVAIELDQVDGLEIAWRVDGGLWSGWRPAAREVTIKHPALRLQGSHEIEVRARRTGSPNNVSIARARVEIDLQAPSVAFVREGDRVLTRAFDSSTPRERLRFRYRLGSDGAWTDVDAEPSFELAAIDAAGGLAVEVIDSSGRRTLARYAVPVTGRR